MRAGRALLRVAAALVGLLAMLADPARAQSDVARRPVLVPKTVHRMDHAAFSHDGRRIATVGDGIVRVLDRNSGVELASRRIVSREILSVSFSPDDASVDVATAEPLIRRWRQVTGVVDEVRLGGPSDASAWLFDTATWTPDGSRLALGDGEGLIVLVDTRAAPKVRVLTPRRPPGLNDSRTISHADLLLSRDATLVLRQDGRRLELIDVDSGQITRQRTVEDLPGGAAFLGAHGDVVYYAGAKLWRWNTPADKVSPLGDGEGLLSTVAALGEDPRVVVCGDASVRTVDIKAAKVLHTLGGAAPCYVSDDGAAILISGTEKDPRNLLIDGNTFKILTAFGSDVQGVGVLQFSRSSGTLLAGGAFTVTRWSLDRPALPIRSRFESVVSAAALRPDGAGVAVHFEDGSVSVIDGVKAGARRAPLALRPDELRAINLANPTGEGNEAGVDLALASPVKALAWVDDELLAGRADGAIFRWMPRRDRLLAAVAGPPNGVKGLAVSPDGKLFATAGDAPPIALRETATFRRRGDLFPLDPLGDVVERMDDQATWVSFAADGSLIAAGGSFVRPQADPRISATSRRGVVVVDLARRREPGVLFAFGRPTNNTEAVGAISGDGRLVLAAGPRDSEATIAERASPTHRFALPLEGALVAATFSPDGRWAATAETNGQVRLWDTDRRDEVARFLIDGAGRWITIAPDGRFDTNDIDRITSFNWLMPDSPGRPLSPNVFMRDYYEPRLLARLIACRAAPLPNATDRCRKEFGAIDPVDALNRVRPTVSLAAGAGLAPDEVVIRWGAGSADDASQPNHKTHTEAYDLRLFRDGQLVGRCPAGTKEAGGAASERQAWREAALVRGPCRAITVRLPSGSGPVTFSAYAFNEDRVKSETVEQTYTSPAPRPARVRHAYVVAMGVDHYAGSGRRDLTFAVKDARDMSGALGRIAGYQVTQVLLTAPKGARSHAAKADLAAVLAILAGDERARARLAGVPGLQDLHAATPDDLVILTFSGHGHTTEDGAFYLLPSDADPTLVPTPATLAGFVSSQDLSRWLETVDAGQLALVIDACHSGASVPKGFKPGPMGDRGLGQLAYDKGMRILAASQADDVALEVRRLRQGLLTYALVQEGLGGDGHGARADLDGDGVTLSEWLAWGEARTPGLYQDVIDHKIRVVRREDGPAIPMPDVVRHTQTPALYDFHRQSTEPVIVAGTRKADPKAGSHL